MDYSKTREINHARLSTIYLKKKNLKNIKHVAGFSLRVKIPQDLDRARCHSLLEDAYPFNFIHKILEVVKFLHYEESKLPMILFYYYFLFLDPVNQPFVSSLDVCVAILFVTRIW